MFLVQRVTIQHFSSANESMVNVTASFLPDDDAKIELNASTITSIVNSEPGALPSKSNLKENRVGDIPLFGRSSHSFVKDSVVRPSKNALSESQNLSSDKLATKVFKDDNTTDLLLGASNENSEPRPLPNFTAVSHNSNTSDSQQ